jgi:hypothetical protein
MSFWKRLFGMGNCPPCKGSGVLKGGSRCMLCSGSGRIDRDTYERLFGNKIPKTSSQPMSFWEKIFGKQPRPSKPMAADYIKNKDLAEHADAIMDMEEARRRGDSAEAKRLAHDFIKSRFAKRGIKID